MPSGLALAVLLLAGPAAGAKDRPDLKKLSSFAFDATLPLEGRVGKIPGWLLDDWREADKAPEYAPHEPSDGERRAIAEAFDGFPPALRHVLEERLIAVYLISGLKGNGLTDWVLDEQGRPYAYMLLNAAALKADVSERLTGRERSAFRGAPALRVEAGGGSGILYSLAHESAHLFDYVVGLSPIVEPEFARRVGRKEGPWDVWTAYFAAAPEADFPERSKLAFYGFGAPALDDAGAACAHLAASPFTSLYGARSQAEDAAELFVFEHLTTDLGRPYRYVCGGEVHDLGADARRHERARRLLQRLYGR